MSVLAAVVALAWGCLLVLTLAMAGMLRQLRELQGEVAQLRAPQWQSATGRRVPELAGVGPLVLLVLDPGCSFCDLVHEPFTQLARKHLGNTRFEVLSPRPRWASTPEIQSRADPALIATLDLPWAPALLHADASGTVLAVRPVRSAEKLDEQVAGLLQAEPAALHWQGAQ
ncbi:MAG TPA: hypothetical protein VIY28_12705 [Pseudonocardiaceae bacterium]